MLNKLILIVTLLAIFGAVLSYAVDSAENMASEFDQWKAAQAAQAAQLEQFGR